MSSSSSSSNNKTMIYFQYLLITSLLMSTRTVHAQNDDDAQELQRCQQRKSQCHIGVSSRGLPITEWDQMLSRVVETTNQPSTIAQIRSTVRTIGDLDFSNLRTTEFDPKAIEEAMTELDTASNILDEMDVTANQLPFDPNILNQLWDLIEDAIGLNLRFLNNVIGDIFNALSLGIEDILEAIVIGILSFQLAVWEWLKWLIVIRVDGDAGTDTAALEECLDELIECDVVSFMSLLVPTMVRAAFAVEREE